MTFSLDQLFTTNWELFGFITGILSVALLLPVKYPRLQYLNWVASVLSALVYVYIFTDYELYGNAALQIYFVFYSIWGLWAWRGQLSHALTDEVPYTYVPQDIFKLTLWLLIPAQFFVLMILAHYNDASPWWDGLIFVLSGAAIWFQVRKYVESWALWIVVDLIAIPLHASNGLGATALLYFFYLLMCLRGIRDWNKAAGGKFHWTGLVSMSKQA